MFFNGLASITAFVSAKWAAEGVWGNTVSIAVNKTTAALVASVVFVEASLFTEWAFVPLASVSEFVVGLFGVWAAVLLIFNALTNAPFVALAFFTVSFVVVGEALLSFLAPFVFSISIAAHFLGGALLKGVTESVAIFLVTAFWVGFFDVVLVAVGSKAFKSFTIDWTLAGVSLWVSIAAS